ncbi:MAG: elongation factor G [Candidatus Krumholzibacteria bacterium]|nr:elongation factor G [Candidatus Krumholzibacteria bacterium]
MKKYGMDRLRNVILVGHQASGKTTLAEAILFNAGVNNRIGRVEDGGTTMDSSPEEISKVISIDAGVAFCEIAKTKVNILDTPGYEDFVGQVLSCLPVVEGGVVVMSAESGVEVGTVKTWKYLDRYRLPRIVCLNKMDKEHANFEKALADAQNQLGAKVMPIQLPIGQGESFKGVVDILKKKAYVYSEGGKFVEEDVPANMKGAVDEYLQKLVDFAAETDDSLLEKFLGGATLSDEELRKGLADGCMAGTLAPLCITSAGKNIGVHQLMDSIVAMLPSPRWRAEIEVRTPGSDAVSKGKTGPDAPPTAFVFKFLSEKNVGDLNYFRVFGGEVGVGKDLLNSNLDTTERMGQLYFVQGRNRVETDSVEAGDIGAAVKLKATRMNQTLCDRANAVIVPEVTYPEPTLSTAIVAKTKGEEDKVATGLAKLKEEDPTFKLELDAELRQMLLSGQGELHLDVLLARLKRKYAVEVEMVQPRIPYRETITAKAEAQGKYKKQSGGRGQYGDCWLRLEPLPRGGGFEFVDEVVGGVVPGKYIPAVEKGVREAMKEGVLAGNTVMDVKVAIYYGSYHAVDSSDNAFKVAGSMGFKAAVLKAKPVILEPIMNVEVLVPGEFMGDVMGDLSARRGKIQGMEQEENIQKIKAQVPLAELHRYSTSLRSMTQGRGVHHQEFSHYEEVPHEVAQKPMAAAQAARSEGN